MGFDRRHFLFLAMLLAITPAARASDNGGNSGSGSSGSGSDGSGDNSGSGSGDSGSGSNSGSGGDDGGSDNSGSGSDDGGSDNSGSGSDDGGKGKSGTEQDDALRAVRDGEIIPLNKAIGIVRSRNPGKVIDVSLKRRSFSDVYSFKIKSSTGRITTVRMDARTGRIVGF